MLNSTLQEKYHKRKENSAMAGLGRDTAPKVYSNSGKARRLRFILYKMGVERGNHREEKVDEACQLLLDRELIKHHYRAGRHDDRKNGIDHFIITLESLRIGFQIKGAQLPGDPNQHIGIERHLKMHPNVPYLGIHGTESAEAVAEMISEKFNIPKESPFLIKTVL